MTLADNLLLVSDSSTGLHIYDVSNLSAPEKRIQIPLDGNMSSAVKDDVIYTNDYGQLQAIRLTDDGYEVLAALGAKYKDYGDVNPGYNEYSSFSCLCTTGTFDAKNGATGSTGSSYATFALVGDQLYRVDDASLLVYDVTAADKPKKVSSNHVGWDIETLFPTSNLLFVGGLRGMYVFDRSDPLHPRQISKIEHARACDPVVVSGSTAYVTLRGGSGCGQAPDELLCVSIKDPQQPRVLGEKPLESPHGLGVQNAQLYVSHGPKGYSLLDVSTPSTPQILKTWPGEPTRDFIWSGATLFVLGEDNVKIYDATDPSNPQLLSQVEPEPVL
jgi:hypothetical protein